LVPEDFEQPQRRFVRRQVGGYWAFVPPPPPTKVQLEGQLPLILSESDRRLGELAGAGDWLPNPHLLIRPFLRREAVLSSRIEGTQASVEDLVLFEAAPGAPERAPDVREVLNYVGALELGFQPSKGLPLSLRLIRELHRVLMTGVRGAHLTPGEFRTSQNWIGPPGCTLDEARYVPPAPDDLMSCLDALEKYLHADSGLPPLVRLAIIHYQFEAIHPFLDGNGRVGRLLISLLLHEWKLLPQPLLYLSAYFEQHRAEYYDSLLDVSMRADWSGWLDFFLRGVAQQSNDAVARAKRLFTLRERYHDKLHGARASTLPLRLVDRLFEQPAVTTALAQEFLEVTRRSAALNIEKLVEAGILREVTGRARNRIFVADEILSLVGERPEPDA
jgi:cell filamentation protein, protein adenylyltransferase